MSYDPKSWLDLEDDVENIPTKRDTRETFPCPSCNGTGRYLGARVHQEKSHCFSCKGKGFFLTDPRKLKERREAARLKKEEKLDLARGVNQATGLLKEFDALRMEEWNQFAASLIEQHRAGKQWSDKQVAAARTMVAKTHASREAKAAERTAEVDLTPIRRMFETARENGHQKPVYRAEGLVINRAPDHGNNPGALYVKTNAGDYMGKVIGTEFRGIRGSDDAKTALLNIAANPLEAAVRWGQKTGRCSCCGRKLTNKLSIELGIGPICRDTWGL